MKFLCVECDEAMRLEQTVGPTGGSMTVVFACPSCGKQTAMLTNSMETQVVRSLGVKIGGRTVAQEPMEMIRDSLVTADEPQGSANSDVGSSRTPHAGESRCTFTGVVNDAFERDREMGWSEGALARIERIPEYARMMVVRGVEQAAREQGLVEITESVLDEVRGRFGM